MKFYLCVDGWIYGCIKADIVIQLEADLFVDTAVIKYFLYLYTID